MATFTSKSFAKPTATAKATVAKGDGFQITAKASEKGCVSLYGLGQRFPVSMYPKALLAVLNRADALRAWVEANKADLNWGDESEKAIPEGRDLIG